MISHQARLHCPRCLLVLALAWGASAGLMGTPALAAQTSLMVVAIPGRAAPDFVGQVVAHIIHPLGEQVTMVTGAQAHAGVVKSGLERSQLTVPRNAARVGKLAGASHVLIVEAAGAGGRSTARASLVEVRSGRVVHRQEVPLKGGHLTTAAAARLAAPVAGKVGGGGHLAAAAPPPAPAAAGGADAWAPGGGDADSGDADSGDDGGDQTPGDDPTAPAPAAAKKSKGKRKGAPAKSDDEAEGADESSASGKGDEQDGEGGEDGGDGAEQGGGDALAGSPRARPAWRLEVGAEMLQREGTLGPLPKNVSSLPAYKGDGQNSNPFFLTGRFNLEAFPLASRGKGAAMEGLGLRADFLLSQVKSVLASSSGSSSYAKSTLVGAKIGVAYRWVLWDKRTAPDLTFQGGLDYFAFPLSQGQFPSVAYSAPFLGARVVAPLGVEQLAVVAYLNFDPKVGASSATKSRLSSASQQAGGSAIELGGGLRGQHKRFAGSLMVRYQRIATSYRGPANFPGVDAQFQPVDTKLNDRFIGILLTGGIVL